MCGLVGVVGNTDAPKIITSILSNLNYRGYDSWGMITGDEYNHMVHRCVGKVSNTTSKRYTWGIGHCRWATDGEPSYENTHPVSNSTEKLLICHNGIYRPKLMFYPLDTRQLVEDICSTWRASDITITQALELVLKGQGNNAVLLVDKYLSNTIYFAAIDRPLYLTHTGIICSDIDSLSKFGDFEVVELQGVGSIRHRNGFNTIKFEGQDYIQLVDFFNQQRRLAQVVEIKKVCVESSLNHFMLNEIREQSNLTDKKSVSFDEPVFIGCGSSYYAGKFAKLVYRDMGLPAHCEYASEFENKGNFYKNFVYLSQSGETADILKCMKTTQNNSLITNNDYGYAKNLAQNVYNIMAGPEYSVAATKTFFFTCLLLSRVAPEVIHDLAGCLTACISVWESSVKSKFDKVWPFSQCLFLGTGLDYPIAQEAALKMKEVCQIPSDSMPAAEIKHGPIALVDEYTLCVVLGSSTKPEVQDNINQVKSRGAKVIVIDDLLNGLPFPTPVIKSLCKVIPCQLLSYYTALELNLNPDKPRNLCKSVTV